MGTEDARQADELELAIAGEPSEDDVWVLPAASAARWARGAASCADHELQNRVACRPRMTMKQTGHHLVATEATEDDPEEHTPGDGAPVAKTTQDSESPASSCRRCPLISAMASVCLGSALLLGGFLLPDDTRDFVAPFIFQISLLATPPVPDAPATLPLSQTQSPPPSSPPPSPSLPPPPSPLPTMLPPPLLPPPLLPPPQSPPPPSLASKVAELNARFHRLPYHATGWDRLANAGILIHQFDNWERRDEEWRPNLYMGEDPMGNPKGMCSSFIHSGQLAGLPQRMQLWGSTLDGLIFRPGFTPLRCGKSMDSWGSCSDWCPSPPADEAVTLESVRGYSTPGDGNPSGCHIPGVKGCIPCAWRPTDFGRFLERQAVFQTLPYAPRLSHNEIIIDSLDWEAALPWLIDAVFTMDSDPSTVATGKTQRIHRSFVRRYPELTEVDVPLVHLNTSNWKTPFTTTRAK